MRVNEIAKKDIITVEPNVTIDDARSLMRMHNIAHLVVSDHSKFIGTIGPDQLIEANPDATVRDVMSKDLVTIDGNEPVGDAAKRMVGRETDFLVVTHDRKAVGVITRTDLLEVFGRGAGYAERMVLRDRGPKRRRARV